MELLRQLDIFQPEKVRTKRIDVIGVGATGSYITWLLSKIGLTNIHIWDDDIVVEHNIPNQCFMLNHVGESKVVSMKEMVKKGTGIDVTEHEAKVVDSQTLGNIVFLLVDSMEMRKTIWENLLKHKLNVECVIETRMSSSSGRVYTFKPYNPTHIKCWEETLCSDGEAEVSSCGSSISIAPTASFVASVAVWQLIKWFNKEEVENEIIMSSRPWTMISRNF